VAQPLDRLANGLVGQPSRGQSLLKGDVGQQVQRPGTPGLAEVSRGLVEDALEWVGLALVKDRLRVLGSALLLGQTARALLVEGVEGVVNGPDGTADVCGDPGRSLAFGTGQEDLGASERERFSTPESGADRLALRVGEVANEQGWFHDPLFGTNHPLPRNRMRLH